MENFWGRRFAALLVDMVIITLLLWITSHLIFILAAVLGIYTFLNYWVFIGAILIIAYFTYIEGTISTTLGKILFKLKVKTKNGNMDYKTAFIRNLSKILWLPLIIDIILGFIFVDSKDRILNQISETFIVDTKKKD
ncbi:MAG: RDD family protein [Methanobacterium sp.]|nr:RDD family protein [Methanobacterium sp.]